TGRAARCAARRALRAAGGRPGRARGRRMMAVRTVAVVVSWEGGAVTDRCVRSIVEQDAPPADVVIVDNASGAAERARLQAAWEGRAGVRLLFLDANRQFAGGLNAGAAAALTARA